MHSHQVQVILLILSFALSLFLLIASAKYAEWARIMVAGQTSGSWLGLVFYIGSIPLLSLFINTLHLLALHFDLLPFQLPPSSSKHSHTQTGYLIQPGLYLLALLTATAQSIMWLGQSSLCTACELAPIASGTQGLVPAWCPQSKFRDTGRTDLPAMLAQLAIVKDISNWLMVPLSCALVECARRQWARARIASSEHGGWTGGLREYDWKSGLVVSALPVGEGQGVELASVQNGRAKPLPTNPGAVEIGMPPTRSNTAMTTQNQPVKQAGLDVGMSYESRV